MNDEDWCYKKIEVQAKSHNQKQAGVQIHHGQGPKLRHLTLVILHLCMHSFIHPFNQSFRECSLIASFVLDPGNVDECDLVPILPEMKEEAMWTISGGEETTRSPGGIKHSNPGFLPFLMRDRDIDGSARPCTEFLWNFGLGPPPSTPQSSLLPLIPPAGPLPPFLHFCRSQLETEEPSTPHSKAPYLLPSQLPRLPSSVLQTDLASMSI